MKRLITAAVVALLVGTTFARPTLAGADSDAAGLLDKTGVKGGLCLVIGAKDTALPKAPAAGSAPVTYQKIDR